MKKQNVTKKNTNQNAEEKTEKKAKSSAKKQVNVQKIAIISLLCCAVALIVTAVCIGVLSGLDDVPSNSSSSPYNEDDDWTNNY